jgi:hypothetical protein
MPFFKNKVVEPAHPQALTGFSFSKCCLNKHPNIIFVFIAFSVELTKFLNQIFFQLKMNMIVHVLLMYG